MSEHASGDAVKWSAEVKHLRELEHAAVIRRVRALADLGLSETFLAMLTAWPVVDVRRAIGARS